MRFWSLMKSPLFSVPIAPVFPESINEQFPLIHLSGLIHVFIFVSGPEDESWLGKGGPTSISTDSFTYPPSFTDLKSVAQYQPTVLLMKTIKEVFNWAIYPLLKSCTVPSLFGIVHTYTHTHTHGLLLLHRLSPVESAGPNNYSCSWSKLEQCPRQIQSRHRIAPQQMIYGK